MTPAEIIAEATKGHRPTPADLFRIVEALRAADTAIRKKDKTAKRRARAATRRTANRL